MQPEHRDQTAGPREPTIVFVGSLPPPVHGAAAVNEVVCDLLRESRLSVRVVSRNSTGLRASRFSRVVHGALATVANLIHIVGLMASRRPVVLYVSLSGDLGQLFELPFIALARASRRRIVFHHHSFAYVSRRSRLTALVFAVAGRSAVHVTACQRVLDGLRGQYPGVIRGVVLRNTSLGRLRTAGARRRGALGTIGFLGNITREKGIDLFLSVVHRLHESKRGVRAVVAGPCHDADVRAELEQAVAHGLIEYWGPTYGPDKTAFFAVVDVLLFPSRYLHETNPVVVVEALSAGSPVICSDVGCLAELTAREGAIVVRRYVDYVDLATAHIGEWLDHPASFAFMSAACTAGELSDDGFRTLLSAVGVRRLSARRPQVLAGQEKFA